MMSGPPSGQPSLAIKFTSAGLAACSAEIATVPFDTAKVRLQVGDATQVITKSQLYGPCVTSSNVYDNVNIASVQNELCDEADDK